MAGMFPGHIPQVRQQTVGPADILQTPAVVVVVIVDDPRVRAFPFGDVCQQAGTTEQVDGGAGPFG